MLIIIEESVLFALIAFGIVRYGVYTYNSIKAKSETTNTSGIKEVYNQTDKLPASDLELKAVYPDQVIPYEILNSKS